MFRRNKVFGALVLVSLVYASCSRKSKCSESVLGEFRNSLGSDHDLKQADSLLYLIMECDSISKDIFISAAYVKRRLMKWDEGLSLALMGLKYSANGSDSIRALEQIMEIYTGKSDLEHAIACCQRMLRFDSLTYDYEQSLKCRLGDMYYDIEKYQFALKHHLDAFNQATIEEDQNWIEWAANELCFDYAKLGEFEMASQINEKYSLGKDSMLTSERALFNIYR